jgi:hypothetical protein
MRNAIRIVIALAVAAAIVALWQSSSEAATMVEYALGS